MIQATVRNALSRTDAQLALRLIAWASDEERRRAESTLVDEGVDVLLDDPRLLAGVLQSPWAWQSSLPLVCYVIVRNALRQTGEHDRLLADYVAAIVLEFGLRDRALRVADVDDEQYTTLADLVAALDGPDPRRNFFVRAHLGNYALWLSGLYPDWIEHRRWRRGGPDLEYYEDLGKRGYMLAADHRLAREHGVAELYLSVAQRFASLRVALNHISDTLLFPAHHTPERLMRQVRNEARWRWAS